MKKNDILLILIPLALFVLSWIGFSVYHNIITSTISQPLSVQIEPITPDFNTNTITSLKARRVISPIYDIGTPTPTPANTSASSSATTTITPTVVIPATAEGSLLQ
jgi:hypothetical protein